MERVEIYGKMVRIGRHKKFTVIDGIPYRERRGSLVAIPEEWFDKTTSSQTIRQRKNIAKHKKRTRVGANIKGAGY